MQARRLNRTIKDATVKCYHYDSHDQLRQHPQLFIDAYNHGRRLKTLRGLTPYEYVALFGQKTRTDPKSSRAATPRN